MNAQHNAQQAAPAAPQAAAPQPGKFAAAAAALGQSEFVGQAVRGAGIATGALAVYALYEAIAG